MQLIQRRLLRKIQVTLHEDHLTYKTTEALSIYEFNVPYDSFYLVNKIKTRKLNSWLLLATIIIGIGTISLITGTVFGKLEKADSGITLTYSIISILLIYACIISYKPKIVVPTSQSSFQLFENNPNPERFDSFLSALKEKQKKSLLNRFVHNKEYQYEGRINNLGSLLKYEIITEAEFKKMKDEIEDEYFSNNNQLN